MFIGDDSLDSHFRLPSPGAGVVGVALRATQRESLSQKTRRQSIRAGNWQYRNWIRVKKGG